MADKNKTTVVVEKKRLSQRQIIGVVFVVVVLVGLLIGWIVYTHRPKSTVPQYDSAALVNEVSKDISKRDFDSAIKLIKGQKIFKETSTQNLLASVYTSKGDFKSALVVYAALDKSNDLTSGAASAAGAIAAQTNDNQTALHYYQEALQKAQADKNLPNQDVIPMYQQKIADLQKKGAK
ncbi:MAG TPA: hypothetical protein VLH14_01985 [Patescibacteria group bacterium]|nr:hypothetical protein [Patescibacteria group bacterium]